MYYCIGEKGKKVEIRGRGLSLGDAFCLYGFDFSGIIQDAQQAQDHYRSGVLRFQRLGGETIPLIQYDTADDEALCCAFQIIGPSGVFVDYDVYALARSLTYVFRRSNNGRKI